MTLVFFMAILLLSMLGQPIQDCATRYLVVTVFALGTGMAGGFLGGAARAEGKLATGSSASSPIAFGLTGGVAVVAVFLALGWWFYARGCNDAVPDSGPIITVPEGKVFAEVVAATERLTGATIGYQNCTEELTRAPIAPATITGTDLKDFLEQIRLRIRGPAPEYTVQVLRDRVRYEIVCG